MHRARTPRGLSLLPLRHAWPSAANQLLRCGPARTSQSMQGLRARPTPPRCCIVRAHVQLQHTELHAHLQLTCIARARRVAFRFVPITPAFPSHLDRCHSISLLTYTHQPRNTCPDPPTYLPSTRLRHAHTRAHDWCAWSMYSIIGI